MKARSLACSEPDLLSGQTNSMHRLNKLIPLSIDVERCNVFLLMGEMSRRFTRLITALQQMISGFSYPERWSLLSLLSLLSLIC